MPWFFVILKYYLSLILSKEARRTLESELHKVHYIKINVYYFTYWHIKFEGLSNPEITGLGNF